MIRLFVLLIVVWLMLTMKWTLPNLILGVMMSLIAIAVTRPTNVALRAYRLFVLSSYFVWEVLAANARICFAILRPRLNLQPAIVAVPVEELTHQELMALATFVTLTPGTLSVDVSPDQSTLYIHTYHLEDADQFRYDVKLKIQRRIQEVFR